MRTDAANVSLAGTAAGMMNEVLDSSTHTARSASNMAFASSLIRNIQIQFAAQLLRTYVSPAQLPAQWDEVLDSSTPIDE